ncbi:Response regulator receiver domain-containing protein [Saccharicrinis carchari]|uniref:Response regulator receiver domain-containing protein n=1 Tax=Saccharicrinis carchari TaxID=1168039 RepID=A0A521CFP9_SACCC|nr:response regulator [Saccharicrinis carchari]SMO58222.1 Response regulator receiver domain-containing protein [Saccharicrinis carchari]
MEAKDQYKKILLIDDDENLVNTYSAMLERKNLADYLIPFSDASDGLSYIQSKPKADLPQYIVLDLYMPQMNGFEFLKRFQQLNEKQSEVEIFVCTSSKKKTDRDKVMQYPCVSAFIQKPLSIDFLELLIKH